MLEVIIIMIGIVLLILGIIGCIVPAIPGPPLNFIALLLLQLLPGSNLTSEFMIWLGVLTVLITLLDYILPIFGAKVFGVSNYGIIGSFVGMIIGILFFPPVGMLIGIIIGAVAGELLAGKNNSEAFRAGIATFFLSILMILLKLLLSVYMTYHFVIESFNILFG